MQKISKSIDIKNTVQNGGAGQYFELLQKRGKKSHIFKDYQLTGLELAELLRDTPHKSLYIKLAKRYHKDILFRIAKDAASRVNVLRRGAYFTQIVADSLSSEERKKIFGK